MSALPGIIWSRSRERSRMSFPLKLLLLREYPAMLARRVVRAIVDVLTRRLLER